MALIFRPPPNRRTHEYRSWRASELAARPICEHCNTARATIIAHIQQPILGGGLMDKSNTLALCQQCDRDFTRSNPPLRRRKTRKDL